MILEDKDYFIWQSLNIHEGYHSPKIISITLACNCLHKAPIFWFRTIIFLNSFPSTLLSSPELANFILRKSIHKENRFFFVVVFSHVMRNST